MVIVHVYVSHNQMVIQGSSCRPRHFLGHSSNWLPDLGPFQHLGRHPGHVLHHHLLPQLLLAETWWNTCETHGETAGALQNALESAGTGVCFWEDEMTWRIRMTTVCWLKQLLVLLTCPCLFHYFCEYLNKRDKSIDVCWRLLIPWKVPDPVGSILIPFRRYQRYSECSFRMFVLAPPCLLVEFPFATRGSIHR